MKPSPMLYRNLLAMDAEELLRANPIDGVVLMGGCDKTVPGLVMGATSMNLPAIFLPAGPMLRGNYRGGVLGSGSDVWKYWAELRAGTIDDCAWREMEDGIARSPGTCMTMGTASTMAIADRGARAVAARRLLDSRPSTRTTRGSRPRRGRRIVEMVLGGPEAARRADGRGLRQRDPRRDVGSADRRTRSSTWWRWRAGPASR